MPKIFCFINNGNPGWWVVYALAEDGHLLAHHVSSETYYAKLDIGFGSTTKQNHDKYAEHYPSGFELVWLDNPTSDEEFKVAAEKYKELN